MKPLSLVACRLREAVCAWAGRLESEESFLTPTPTASSTPFYAGTLGTKSQAGISGLLILCCSNKYYHCYMSDVSQARIMQASEEVHFMF